MRSIRLGLNIDHVATLRNARGGVLPDPLRAARIALDAGVDGITAHLREDRRHIRDQDMERLKAEIPLPLNMEMAATDEMVAIARRILPHASCLVPEKREEKTTEGGLDVVGGKAKLYPVVQALNEKGIRVSLFIEPEPQHLDIAKELGAPVVELHTGSYCEAFVKGHKELAAKELLRLQKAASHALAIGLECHAGHGLDYDTACESAKIPNIVELNIGHFIVGEAVFLGLEQAIANMRAAINKGISG